MTTMHGDPLDPDRFRVTDDEMTVIAAERRAKTSGKATAANGAKDVCKTFVRYPIEQYTRLAGAGHYRALALYGWLVHLDWKTGRRVPIKVTNKVAASVGLNRWAKDSGLQKLEDLGLIRVQRCKRRSPLVTVL
jgi:hypothetical protein